MSVERSPQEALMLAAAEGVMEGARLALAGGADMEARDERGMTAAMVATKAGHVDILGELVGRGANLGALGGLGGNGWDIPMWAAYWGQEKCLSVALGAGGSTRGVDRDGNTAAILAAFHGSESCLRLLLALDPSLAFDKDADGMDCVMCAAHRGHVGCLQALLDAGANAEGRDWRGSSALDLARKSGHHDAAAMLQSWREAEELSAVAARHPPAAPAKARRM